MPAKKTDFKPVKLKRTFEIVVDLLRKKIFDGELQIGDRLPSERELAQMVEVSRNTVRQAYHVLNLLGIVEISKGVKGGAIIREPSNRPLTQSLNDLLGLRRMKLEDMAEARLFLEKDIIELVCRHVTQVDIETLKQCAQKSLDLIEQEKPAHKQNLIFHHHLADIAGNPVLKMVYSSVLDLLSMIVETTANIEMSSIIAQEHMEFIDLLKEGDLERLLNFTEDHICGSNDRLLAVSDGKPFLTEW